MNSQEIKEIQEKINQMENNIRTILESRPLYPRIIILGLTGAGKSSLACCLANKKCIVKREAGSFTKLEGEGIFAGCKAGTEEPKILIDDNNGLLLCDCPGFADVRGMKCEIINAFADNCIFYSCNQEVKIKILLVVSVTEMRSQRGKIFLETIDRMKKIFPDPDELKKGIGLILTKGDKDIPNYEYFQLLQNRSQPELKKWCDFFIAFNDEQVFSFPLAEKDDIDKMYTFADCDKLLLFMKSEY